MLGAATTRFGEYVKIAPHGRCHYQVSRYLQYQGRIVQYLNGLVVKPSPKSTDVGVLGRFQGTESTSCFDTRGQSSMGKELNKAFRLCQIQLQPLESSYGYEVRKLEAMAKAQK
jgi:hypothetical protein